MWSSGRVVIVVKSMSGGWEVVPLAYVTSEDGLVAWNPTKSSLDPAGLSACPSVQFCEEFGERSWYKTGGRGCTVVRLEGCC